MTGPKASSTERAYAGAWAKWKAWAKRQGWEPEYFNRKGDPLENENQVRAFIGYLGWLGGAATTLKQAVFAIKDAHKGRSRRSDREDAPPVDLDKRDGEEGRQETTKAASYPGDVGLVGTTFG